MQLLSCPLDTEARSQFMRDPSLEGHWILLSGCFPWEFTPFKGTGSLLSRVLSCELWSCDSHMRILTLDSVCLSTSDPLKTLRDWNLLFKRVRDAHCSSPSSLYATWSKPVLSLSPSSCKNLPMSPSSALLAPSQFILNSLGDPLEYISAKSIPVPKPTGGFNPPSQPECKAQSFSKLWLLDLFLHALSSDP